jgi:hypothetical protein
MKLWDILKNHAGVKTMTQPTTRLSVSLIIPDEAVYPGKLKPEIIAILKDTGAAIDGGNP